ncbi:hypothetical protein HUJ04_000764 [Dendroctonus ponderosae]|uniref:26S proteasome non-ATPase regulatory subunit 6 n=1 Tax=Dendroctonus ponderosae TaxID=77166 RepID=A0AAR5PEW3_DENPD|nr:hypothetical protein HUJ04_000764 [Dendroctonus ponderosae]
MLLTKMEELNSSSDEAIFYDAVSKADFDQANNSNIETLKNPDLEIAQLEFWLRLPEFLDDESKRNKLLECITKNNMAPYYQHVCSTLNWTVNTTLLNEMRDANSKALQSFEDEIEYACIHSGAIDIKQAYLNKANYLSKIGDKENTIKTLSQAYANTVDFGSKLDNVFHCIRIGLFFSDLPLIRSNLLRCEDLIEEGADWHHRNCFRIYQGLHAIATRDFSTSCELFTSSIETFVCTEVISFDQFIKYTVLSAMIILNRSDLKKKIISNPDVLQAMHCNNSLKEFVFTFYHSEYKKFYQALAEVEADMKRDMLLYPHYRFYVREMKIKACDQLLSSYISLKISYMADQFGVSEDYVEDDISHFIASKRLNYKIDKISGQIVNVRSHGRAGMFENLIKQGDLLINRIDKLSRIIDI